MRFWISPRRWSGGRPCFTAGPYDDPKIGKLLSELARWEKRHIQIVVGIEEHLSERTWELGHFGPERLDTGRPGLPNKVFDEHADPSKELTGDETKTDVLRMAIKKEKDAIAYYTSLKELVLGEQNVEAVNDIIQEEERHVRILTQSLEQIMGAPAGLSEATTAWEGTDGKGTRDTQLHESTHPRDEPLPVAARTQPRRLVPLGR